MRAGEKTDRLDLWICQDRVEIVTGADSKLGGHLVGHLAITVAHHYDLQAVRRRAHEITHDYATEIKHDNRNADGTKRLRGTGGVHGLKMGKTKTVRMCDPSLCKRKKSRKQKEQDVDR